jgi:hypothetical protein
MCLEVLRHMRIRGNMPITAVVTKKILCLVTVAGLGIMTGVTVPRGWPHIT